MKENSLDLKDLNVLPAPRTPEGPPPSQKSLTGSGEEPKKEALISYRRDEEPQKVGPRNQQSVEKRGVHDTKRAKRRSETFVEAISSTPPSRPKPIPSRSISSACLIVVFLLGVFFKRFIASRKK